MHAHARALRTDMTRTDELIELLGVFSLMRLDSGDDRMSVRQAFIGRTGQRGGFPGVSAIVGTMYQGRLNGEHAYIGTVNVDVMPTLHADARGVAQMQRTLQSRRFTVDAVDTRIYPTAQQLVHYVRDTGVVPRTLTATPHDEVLSAIASTKDPVDAAEHVLARQMAYDYGVRILFAFLTTGGI